MTGAVAAAVGVAAAAAGAEQAATSSVPRAPGMPAPGTAGYSTFPAALAEAGAAVAQPQPSAEPLVARTPGSDRRAGNEARSRHASKDAPRGRAPRPGAQVHGRGASAKAAGRSLPGRRAGATTMNRDAHVAPPAAPASPASPLGPLGPSPAGALGLSTGQASGAHGTRAVAPTSGPGTTEQDAHGTRAVAPTSGPGTTEQGAHGTRAVAPTSGPGTIEGRAGAGMPGPHAVARAPGGWSAATAPSAAKPSADPRPEAAVRTPRGLAAALQASGAGRLPAAAQPSTPAASAGSAAAATGEPVASQVLRVVSPLISSQDGTYLLRLDLTPPGLGTVRATVVVRSGEFVAVRLVPVSSSAHGELLAAAGELQSQLASGSGTPVHVEIGSVPGGGSGGAPGGGSAGTTGAAHDGNGGSRGTLSDRSRNSSAERRSLASGAARSLAAVGAGKRRGVVEHQVDLML